MKSNLARTHLLMSVEKSSPPNQPTAMLVLQPKRVALRMTMVMRSRLTTQPSLQRLQGPPRMKFHSACSSVLV